MKALLLRLAYEKFESEGAIGIATSTRLQDHHISFFERRRNVVREQQVRQQARLINGKGERENPAMIKLRNFLDVVHQLKARLLSTRESN